MINKARKRTERSRTMKAVVARLRADASAAVHELVELDVAVGELSRAAQGLAASANALVRDASSLAEFPPLGTPARFRSLAEGASRTSEMAQTQASTLLQLKRVLDAWSIKPPRPQPEDAR